MSWTNAVRFRQMPQAERSGAVERDQLTVGLAQIAPLRAVTTLLTDDRLPPGAAEVLSEQVAEVIIIPTSEH